MIDFESLMKNESVEDILLYLAPRTTWPAIDRIFVCHQFEVVAKSGLYPVYKKLIDEGRLDENNMGHTIKGPNWREPAFVTQKKYGIK